MVHVRADETAGCAREIMFPYLGIRRIVPEGDMVTLELLPKDVGTFKFRCSMDMTRWEVLSPVPSSSWFSGVEHLFSTEDLSAAGASQRSIRTIETDDPS